jgi:hypothetical protein
MRVSNFLYLPSGGRIAVNPVDAPQEFTMFDLVINEGFDPENPVLKNGHVLTGDAVTAWQGIDWLLDNLFEEAYLPSGTLESRASRQSLYYYAREVAIMHNLLMTVLRLFGDARALDLAVEIADLQYAKLIDEPFIDLGTNVALPVHPYKRWPWDFGSRNELYYGNDNHNLDVTRSHTPIAQLLYALRQNEGKTSPAGYNYAAKANIWEEYLAEHFVPAWQGPENDTGITKSGGSWVPSAGWIANYKGNLHAYYTGTTSSSRRAGVSGYDDWPILSRHLTHTHVGGAALHYWLGKAIPDFADATPVGLDGIQEAFLNRNIYYFDPLDDGVYSGAHAIWPRGLHFTGHGDDSDPTSNYAQPSVYTSYVFMDIINMWLEGAIPDMPEVFGIPVTRTMNTYMFKETNAAGSWIAGSLFDDKSLSLGVAENSYGNSIPFISAEGESGYGSASLSYAGSNTGGMFIAFDTPDNYLEGYMNEVLEEATYLSDSKVGISKPKVLSANIGIILKNANAREWVLDESI